MKTQIEKASTKSETSLLYPIFFFRHATVLWQTDLIVDKETTNKKWSGGHYSYVLPHSIRSTHRHIDRSICTPRMLCFLLLLSLCLSHIRKAYPQKPPACLPHMSQTSRPHKCTLLARLNFVHTPVRKKRSFFCFFFLLLFFFTFSLSMSSSSKSLRSKTSDLSNRAHIHTYKKTMRSARLQFLGHTRLISNTRKCEKVKRRSRIRAQNDYM